MGYKGVVGPARMTVVGPYLSYRAVLNEARTYAFNNVVAVTIMSTETGAVLMTVRPDGSTRKPG